MPFPSAQTFSRVAEHFATVGTTDPLTLLNESSGDPFQLREQWLDAVVDVVVVFPSKNEYIPLGYEMISSSPTALPADLNTGTLGLGQGPMYLCVRRRRNLPKADQPFHPHISDIAIVKKSAFEMKMVDALACGLTQQRQNKNQPTTPMEDANFGKTGWRLIETSVSGRPADLNHDRPFGALGPNNEKSIFLAVKVERVKSRHSSTSVHNRSTSASSAGSEPTTSAKHARGPPEVRFHVPPAILSICVCVAGERPPHGYELLPQNINANAVGGGKEVRIGKMVSGPLGLCDQLWVASTLDSIPKGPKMFTPAFALPAAELPSFIFPSGGARLLHRKGRNAPLPSRFEFLFTGVNGDKMFASALLFHERVDQADVDKLMKKFSGVWGSVDDVEEESAAPDEATGLSTNATDSQNRDNIYGSGSGNRIRLSSTNRMSFSSVKQAKLSELLELCKSLQENITIQDRPYHLKVYPNCFLGSEAVSHVSTSFCNNDRAKAIEMLDDAIRAGMVSHVTNEHMMEDGFLFFKFQGDALALASSPERDASDERLQQSWKTWFSPSKSERKKATSSSPSLQSDSTPTTLRSRSASFGVDPKLKSKAKSVEDRLYAPKVLVILSQHPLYRSLSLFLTQLYALSLSPSPAPLERHISTFLSHLPLPTLPNQSHHVHLDLLLNEGMAGLPAFKSTLPPIIIPPKAKPGTCPPQMDLDFLSVFRGLSVPNLLKVFTVLLREGRVLILSSCGALLTETCEIIRTLLFPLDWQCCYVPRLPEGLVGALEAPGGYLIGVLTGEAASDMPLSHIPIGGLTTSLSSLIRRQLAEGVCVVALDQDVVLMGEVNDDLLREVMASSTTDNTPDNRESFFAENPTSVETQRPQADPPHVAMSTPSSVPLSPPNANVGLTFDQVVFNDPGPKPPKKPLLKLQNRLETLRIEAQRALNLVNLPLTPTDRSNYASAYNFAPVPAYVDDESSESDEEGQVQGSKGNRRRNKLNDLSAGVRDAFIRFMCHPLVLGSYSAYIENSDATDAKEIEEYRNVVMVQQQQAETPNSASPGDPSMLGREVVESLPPRQDSVDDRGFYDIFDESGFIKCGSVGKSLRQSMVGTQMFVVLVEERWGINSRRRSLEPSAIASRFAGRESALFFERCCKECKKKAQSKLKKQPLPNLLKYPAERGADLSKVVKPEQRIEVQVSETLRRERRKKNKDDSSLDPSPLIKQDSSGSNLSGGGAPLSISLPPPPGSNRRSGFLKALQVIGGTGVGLASGIPFGPLGMVVGAVIGTGVSAATVTSNDGPAKKKKPLRRRGKTRSSSGSAKHAVPQPTILSRAQIFAAFGSDVQHPPYSRPRRVIVVDLPGATTVDLDGKLWEYDRWPILDVDMVLVPDHAVPPVLKKLQGMASESEVTKEMMPPNSPRPSSVSDRLMPPSLFRSETVNGVSSWETDALTSSSYVYSLYFLSLPSRLSSRLNTLGQVREILACLGLLKKLQGVGQGISHPHSLTGGLTSLLSSESLWRTILVSVGSVQSSLEKYKTEFVKNESVDAHSQAKVTGTLSEGVSAGKRIGLELFKGMKQAGVAASQITLAHYLQSASSPGASKLHSYYGISAASQSWRNAMGARQPSSLSNDSEGGKGEESLLVSMEVGECVRGSSFSGAVVLHNTGLTTPETLMPLGEFLLFETSTFPSLVALGVRWIRDGCGIGLAENLIEAARVSAGIERCEFEKNLDGYFRGYVPPSPNESRENSFTVQAGELKEPNSPKRFDTPPVPPSTPIRANKRHIDPFFGKPGAAAEEGIGGNTDADAAITSTEEQSFASQFMWNYEPCGFCKVPPMDEEILAAWIEQPSSAEKVRREIETIRKVGGLSREGGRRRRTSKNGNFSSTGHGAVGNDAVIAAAEAALLSAQSAPYNEKILSFDEDQFSEGSDTLNLVCLAISCPNCGKSYKPMLNFESVCPVAGGEEFVKVDNSEGRVAYMPPEVLHNLWEAITNLHGRVAGGSPEWLALNKPQLYHNLLWWTSRRLDIPKHIQFPLVGVGWKKSVARHRVAYEVDAGGNSAPPQLKLGKSVSNETNSGRSNSLKVGMEPKEIFKEEGINAEEESGRKFLETIEEALTLLRRDQGNLGEAMEVVGRAVQLITAEGMGWGKGKRERRKLTYSCVVQLCAHYEISHLSVVSSLDLLNLLPKLESVLGEEDGGEGKWDDVSVGGRGCAMRSVFGHLY